MISMQVFTSLPREFTFIFCYFRIGSGLQCEPQWQPDIIHLLKDHLHNDGHISNFLFHHQKYFLIIGYRLLVLYMFRCVHISWCHTCHGESEITGSKHTASVRFHLFGSTHAWEYHIIWLVLKMPGSTRYHLTGSKHTQRMPDINNWLYT